VTDGPLAKLRAILDEVTAARILDEVRDEHRHKYLRIAVHPSQYEPIRQAICNVDPLLEGSILPRSIVKPGTVIFMDTSILEDSFAIKDWQWHD
jgi:hypothetical protein